MTHALKLEHLSKNTRARVQADATRRFSTEHRTLLMSLLKWTALGSLVGVLTGSASALFLWSLDHVTATREANPWLLFFLPVGGMVIGWLYQRFGQLAGRGNNLIIDNLHGSDEGVPLRMAPMILFGTLVTHLLGGSVGREGTAVQMGGSLADSLARALHLKKDDRRLLLMSGVSGGFASVFGTPLAGTIFGLEFAQTGVVRYDGLVPCLVAALVGNQVAHLWGVRHTGYSMGDIPPFSASVFAKVALAGLAFGLAALLFAEMLHLMKRLFAALVPSPILRPAVGGLVVIALVYLVRTRDYIGLSESVIRAAFAGDVSGIPFFWKTLFTAVTLGAGFQGGEVTPLFLVGSTLGNALSRPLSLPTPFLAGLGFVAVLAGAANTPLACIVLGVELFGGGALPYLAVACVFAYVFSGHHGVYSAQRVGVPKSRSLRVPDGATIGAVHEREPEPVGR